jgi:heme/copper-type cytochrome/quinol oxidase subunit 2
MLVGSKYEAYKYPTGRERVFLEVKVEGEQWNWRFKVKVEGEGEQWNWRLLGERL